MNEQEPIRFTTRDRLMRAWQNSMEMVRDLELYAKQTQEHHPDAAEAFAHAAEDAGEHASRFRELLHRYTD